MRKLTLTEVGLLAQSYSDKKAEESGLNSLFSVS